METSNYEAMYPNVYGNRQYSTCFGNRRCPIPGSYLDCRYTSCHQGIADCDLLIVAFSSLGFSASLTMIQWIRTLPRRPGAKLALLCVCGSENRKGKYSGGWSGDALFSAARIVARRGWEIVGLSEASYPLNWTEMSNPPEEQHLPVLLEKGDHEVRSFSAALAGGSPARFVAETATRKSAQLVAVMFRLLGRRALAALFVSDTSCTSCGLCARSCPAQAIRIRSARPVWSGRCDSCNRCINICPSRSIVTSNLLMYAHITIAVALAIAAFAIPLTLGPVGTVLARIALLLIGPVLQFAILAPVLSWLSRIPALRKIFSRSFMRNYRRYREARFMP